MKITNLLLGISVCLSFYPSFGADNGRAELELLSRDEVVSVPRNHVPPTSSLSPWYQTICKSLVSGWRDPLVKVQDVMYAFEGIDKEDLVPRRIKTQTRLESLLGLLRLQSQPAQIPLTLHKVVKYSAQCEGEMLQRQLQQNPEFQGVLWLDSGDQSPSLSSYPPVQVERFDKRFQENLASKKAFDKLKEDYVNGKSNLLAYEILNQHGGVFAKEEAVLTPIAPLNKFFNFYTSCTLDFVRKSFSAETSLIASSAYHPAIRKLIQGESCGRFSWLFSGSSKMKFLQGQQLQPYKMQSLDSDTNKGLIALSQGVGKENNFYCVLLSGLDLFSKR